MACASAQFIIMSMISVMAQWATLERAQVFEWGNYLQQTCIQ